MMVRTKEGSKMAQAMYAPSMEVIFYDETMKPAQHQFHSGYYTIREFRLEGPELLCDINKRIATYAEKVGWKVSGIGGSTQASIDRQGACVGIFNIQMVYVYVNQKWQDYDGNGKRVK
jgi:hypothetical protein